MLSYIKCQVINDFFKMLNVYRFNNSSNWHRNFFQYYEDNMVMDGFYVQDKLPALWHKINQLHLSYLEMEESPQKLDQRTKLEGNIHHLPEKPYIDVLTIFQNA